jgi:hypothetical protein
MAKDTFYFSHDYNARNDIKIKKLLSKHGYLGYGIFWAIIEDLYNNTNVLRLDYDTISFDLRCEISIVKSIINDFDLFVIDGDIFGSTSVERRLEERNEKSEKARQSVLKRWSKKEIDTNVLQTNNDSNTIKERKGKENNIKGLHLFKNSIIFDKNIFKQTFPNWSIEKLKYYYESANDYSESKGKMYKDWIAAIRSWERKDQIKGDVKYSQAKQTKHAGLI